MPLITEHCLGLERKQGHVIGDSLSLRSCSGEHGRKSLECDWLSPWSRMVTADMSVAQQKAAALGGAASAETLPRLRADTGLVLIKVMGFAAQPEDLPGRVEPTAGPRMDAASGQPRRPFGSSRVMPKQISESETPRGGQASCSGALEKLALLCLPPVVSLTYTCSQRHCPTDKRARQDPPTLIRGKWIKNACPLLDRL